MGGYRLQGPNAQLWIFDIRRKARNDYPGSNLLRHSRQEHAGMTDEGIGRTIISCHAPKNQAKDWGEAERVVGYPWC